VKKVYNYWFPDTDIHFERMFNKSLNKGGPAEYQYEVRDKACEYVNDFSLAIDIGANVGLWARPLSEKFTLVKAYEPMSQVLECLHKNCAGHNVEIHEHALGNTNGTVEMIFTEDNTGNSYISGKNGSIKIARVDDLDLPKFGLLKLDVERHELEVLKGATETILKYKPIVVCEQHPDTEYGAGSFLKDLGAKELGNVSKDYIFGW
tara:strand:+ start:461 stop:1078 length:618 start_codon:yes stop_codon:yes gene_type:complete